MHGTMSLNFIDAKQAKYIYTTIRISKGNCIGNFAVNKYLHTVASGWIFINTELRFTERA